jgi:hypothetical protein
MTDNSKLCPCCNHLCKNYQWHKRDMRQGALAHIERMKPLDSARIAIAMEDILNDPEETIHALAKLVQDARLSVVDVCYPPKKTEEKARAA